MQPLGGVAMTFTFTALLCLGLTLSLRTPVLVGTLPKPILKVKPDSVVPLKTEVTFVCEGTRGATEYSLYREGDQNIWKRKIPLEPENKVEFTISEIDQNHARQYRCFYQIGGTWSEDSDPLGLMVTGAHSKPSLSAQPSPVVTPGGNVILWCVSGQQYNRFILIMEGPQKLSWRQNSHYDHYTRKFQALFPVGPVTSSQRWTFRCYSYDWNRPQVWSYPSDPLELLFSGTLPKTIIMAEPGSVIASGSSVTIWCHGNLNAEIYVLHKEGSQNTWGTQTPEEPWNKTKFSTPSVTHHHAGQYRCYSYSSAGWSERSDTLELVVTGIHYGKPTLSALPSPVVSSGGNLTLQCVSHTEYNKFTITKDDEKFPSYQNTLYIYRNGHYQAMFTMEHMTPNHTGTFRCYGYYKNTPQLWSVPSEPLEILFSGLSKKPSLLTHQGHILEPGKRLTLQCSSDINYDRFALYKVGEVDIMQHHVQQTQTGLCLANFTLGYVSQSTGGQYRCYGAHNLSFEWSASSDPMDILITGQFLVTPFLSVKPNSTVHSGQNVTLLCQSDKPMDTFILSKEGSDHQPLRLKSKFQDGQFQAEFSMTVVNSTIAGTYRCYASQDSSLYLLSYASAPVDLIVSGLIEPSSLPPSRPMPPAGLESYLNALIGVSVAFLLFLFILIFLLLRRRKQGKYRKDARKETELQLPEGLAEPVTRDGDPQKRPDPAAATQEEGLYASVEDMGPEEDVELDSQAADPEEPQDVTYAQLCIKTLSQGTAAPPLSQAVEAPEEPTVYAALAASPPGAVPKDKDQ